MEPRWQKGSLFADRYRVVRLIGSGGMGEVYEVEHTETERRLALKMMLPQALENAALRERFKTEVKLAARIRSDHVVDVFDAGVDEATRVPFLVMELLDGEDLGARLQRLGRLPPDEVVTCLHQAALGIDKLHRASIVHRDLKPQNLFLTRREDGSPYIKILDFGVAKVLAGGATSGLTAQSNGTPLYMAPEQFAPEIKISPATDIYAIGMVAYTLLVGEPYWGPELAKGLNVFVLARLAEAGPKEPASVRAAACHVTLPPAFDAWFLRATAPNPAHRFQNASDAVAALAQAFGAAVSQPTSVPPLMFDTAGSGAERKFPRYATPISATASSAAPPSARRSHWMLFAGPAAAIVIGGFVILSTGRMQRPPVEIPSPLDSRVPVVTTTVPEPQAPPPAPAAPAPSSSIPSAMPAPAPHAMPPAPKTTAPRAPAAGKPVPAAKATIAPPPSPTASAKARKYTRD